MADPLADLQDAIRTWRETARIPYLRDAHLPPGQVLVMTPAITGHDRDVLIIPTGERGDRILDALRDLGCIPERYTQTLPGPDLVFSPIPIPDFDAPTSPGRIKIVGV